MIDEAALRMAAFNLEELRKSYAQVLAERDAAIAEVAHLRQIIDGSERGNERRKRHSSRGLGPPPDGNSRPVSGRSSGSFVGKHHGD